MAKTISGRVCIKILCRCFGFFVVSQRGSHVKLRKEVGNRTLSTVVPLHSELAFGTLRGLLALAEVNEEEFRQQM